MSARAPVVDDEKNLANLLRGRGETYFDDDHGIEVPVAHLRKKLEEDPKNPRYARTGRGVGYRFAR